MNTNNNNKCLKNIEPIPEFFEGETQKERVELAIKNLYEPAFENSNKFFISTGSFSSTFFSIYKNTIANFAFNGGKIKIISENALTLKDFNAIMEGYDKRSKIEQIINSAIENVINLTKNIPKGESPVAFLGWLISENILDMKVGIPKNQIGIHHAKYNIWIDDHNDSINVIGSHNASQMAQLYNQEDSEIFHNWGENKSRNERAIQRFNKWWENSDENFLYFPIPEAALKKLIKEKPSGKINLNEFGKKINKNIAIEAKNYPDLYKEELNILNSNNSNSNKESKQLELPTKIKIDLTKNISLRPYQTEALKAWEDNNNNGLLSMATGTGKTIIGIAAAKNIFDKKKKSILIAVPKEKIADQWIEEINTFFPEYIHNKVIRIGTSKSSRLTPKVINDLLDEQRIIISTYTSLASSKYMEIFNYHKNNIMIIADEAHNLGSTEKLKIMDIEFIYKLGLTATPQRNFDEDGTDQIIKYFNGQVYAYSVIEAIKDKWLCEYNYSFETCYLTYDEMNDYKDLSKKIFPDQSGNFNESQNKRMIARANIGKTAQTKPMKLKDIFIKNSNILNSKNYSLIFCNNTNQLREIHNQLEEIGIFPYVYFGEMHDDADKTIDNFITNGGVLIAMEMLKEGVNIPQLSNLLLVSSSKSELESVQRRGRVLRKDKNNQNKIANIYDIIVLPDPIHFDDQIKSDAFENLVNDTEIERIKLFQEASKNQNEIATNLSRLQLTWRSIN